MRSDETRAWLLDSVVSNQPVEFTIEPLESVLDVLRERLALTDRRRAHRSAWSSASTGTVIETT
jgi:aerobic-type carbon monoxide dehydrogenase small subunit (CoxS/CutS family)